MGRPRRRRWLLGAPLTLLSLELLLPGRAGAAEETLLEFHYTPVPNLQIAIWIEDADGNLVKDVFVTQATGKLGIGNRPGLWNFLSSWHAPYGPRLPVLPVWGHRRGKTYPALTFHDSNAGTQTSLGFHEGTSSFESYFCRPLRPDENDAVIDAMTCPSPQVFQSDKGRFSGKNSIYPPRNDLLPGNFEDGDDHPDVMMYEAINDLDAITGATPAGGAADMRLVKITTDEAGTGPLVAWIEVSLEHDENADWDFDRSLDHFVDPKLPDYGVEWLGQPSILYRVEFDPAQVGFSGTDDYYGYGSWDGTSGEITPPDSTISTANGSGADRLQQMEAFADIFRFGVYSHGFMGGGTDGGTDGGSGSDGGTDGGGCWFGDLPAVTELAVTPTEFDRAAVSFTLPAEIPPESEPNLVRVFYQPSQDVLDAETVLRGQEQEFALCPDGGGCELEAEPGDRVELEVDQLFGDFTYQFAVLYQDRCDNSSPPTLSAATTPIQKFQQIDTFCVVATAAYGASWASEVGALRAFRDAVLKPHPAGRTLIAYYYAYGPSVARILATSAPLRAGTRALLQPLAEASQPLARWSK